jgi:hypothetical protein
MVYAQFLQQINTMIHEGFDTEYFNLMLTASYVTHHEEAVNIAFGCPGGVGHRH